LKDVRSSEEERPFLGKERLECREVDYSGIYFYLSKIRIYCRRKCKTVWKSIVEITAN